MKEMVGGCCVCSDERGWAENPLVYCDGQGCNVAVHQACYGIVQVPTGPWFCRKCESQERSARVRCELCPSKDGALKRTDSSGWAHVVCALYIPEVRFGNVTTMEPIILQLVPQERYNKLCYICEEQGKESKASVGACMQCNKSGCKQYFHVTCAQAAGLLCEEAGNYMDNVKYCGYCLYHYQKLVSSQQTSCKVRVKKDTHIKTIPAFKPIPADNATPEPSPEKATPAQCKERNRRSDKRNRQAANAASNSVNVNTNTDSVSVNLQSSNTEQGFQSDSSASTISNSSITNLNANSNDSCKNVDSKNKKSEFLCNSNSSSSKFAASNFKDTSVSPSHSPIFVNEKGKKKSKELNSDSDKRNSLDSKDSKEATAAPTFSSMYESFINKDLKANCSNQESKPASEKRKSAESAEEPEKKKSKHSKSKSKSTKSLIEAVIPPEKCNPQIPIVRIKRKFNHDKSCSSHSVEKVEHETVISVPESRCAPELKVISPKIELQDISNDQSESLPANIVEIKCEIDPPEEEDFMMLEENDLIDKVASILRTTILKMEKTKLPAAMKTKDLINGECTIPEKLDRFFKALIGGNMDHLNAPLKLWIQWGVGNHERLINVNELYQALGKLRPFKLLEKSVEYQLACQEITTDDERVLERTFDRMQPPTSLEDLLEKQWMQTSNFLMGQAQHFDIATLLSSLYQLKTENHTMEKQVQELISRRDALLAINARLKALPAEAVPNNLPYSALSLLAAKPLSPSDHHPAATFAGYIPFENAMVHSTQDFNCHKSPLASHSPAATVGSSSLPLTPSPIPCSPMTKPDVFPQLSAFTRDSSPLNHMPIVTSATSQPAHMFSSPGIISNSLLIPENSSYNNSMVSLANGSTDTQEQEPSTAVYQTISPPFSNPETNSPTNTTSHSVCNNLVFHQTFENALQNNNSSNEEDR
ncbi:uncharacterized protein LOC129228700 [Uloborus diversus]|uniref:uncharacterized protein LOC129228700 n=1 Tax=Uloborus diversus TaxID=327109 RepID=UPI002409853D|nr:uncharacterized protein LOC129228700 [Uloborus diversus]